MIEKLKNQSAIIIPIRMSSSRLPGKFHAEINNKPMILHMVDRARETGIKNIFIACDHQEHFDLVTNYGAEAIMTGMHHQSGSDRVFEALNIIDPEKRFKYVVNLQGDIPFVMPETINTVLKQLITDEEADISTMLTHFRNLDEIRKANYVKAIFDVNHHALYFSRLPIPYTENLSHATYYHHIGIYAYRREALEKFVSLPQSFLEINEKLEQLRALENGMKIKIGLTDDLPISVDVPEDLEIVRNFAMNRKYI